jgi:hypothetical protein
MCGYVACVPECRGSFCRASQLPACAVYIYIYICVCVWLPEGHVTVDGSPTGIYEELPFYVNGAAEQRLCVT